ncbi:F-box protein [Pyrus ussuriensis x Pyrus communis]|uniref:F-box protein n=1 Tax=Pyrus ussuriensis x Pyrus communis TaxID=2448454 RepID=A0A5N5FJX8_9ROSA|nr:F-box protein [Pyrus ussuriensis x Pyrus communis]
MPCPRITPVSLSTTGWASLSALIFLILDRLPKPIDHVRFAAVCKEWRSLSKLYNLATNRWRQLLPMLLIPDENRPQADQRLVYSVSEGRIYNHAQLQVPFKMRACGSSHGWLATVEHIDEGLVVALRNPFRQASPVIRLPPIDVFIPKCVASYHEHFVRKVIFYHEHFVRKVILYGDPSLNPDNYVVVAIYASNSRLAVFKAGQKSWHLIVKSFETADVIFYRGQVYAASMWGSVSSLDIDNPGAQPPQLKLLTPKVPFERYSSNGYLMESTKGDLFHILRYCWMREVAPDRYFRFLTKGFLVYKWVTVQHL